MRVASGRKIVGFQVVSKKDSPVEKTPKTKEARPVYLPGGTYKIRHHRYDDPFYITINFKDGKPFEIFIVTSDIEAEAWTRALTRSWSAVMRVEDDIQFLIDEMRKVRDPKGGHSAHETFHNSFVAEVGYILDRVVNHDGVLGKLPDEEPPVKEAPAGTNYLDLVCPECNEKTMRMIDGCPTCVCGYSKCS